MKNKKNKLANLLKIGTFFLGISMLLLNCQKENDFIVQEQIEVYQPTINYLSGNDIPNLVNTIASKVGGKVSAKNKGGDITINTSFGEITFDKVMQVIDSVGNTNYTFKVFPTTPNDKVFYNLVINENSKEPFIFEYIMSDDFYVAYKNNALTLQQFSGSIKRYKLTNLKSANKTLGKGDFESCPNVVMVDNGDTTYTNGGGGGGNLSGDGTSGNPGSGGIDAGGGATGGGVSYPTIPCRLVVRYNLCSSGGGGHPPACQHAGGIHDQPENNELCESRCTGSTLDTAYLTGDCGNDDASDTHNSNRTSPSCPDSDGDIGVIIPFEVEVLLRKLRIELDLNNLQNAFLRSKPNIGVEIYYFLEDNNWSTENKNFAKQAINFLQNNIKYNFSHYINWFGITSEGKDYEYDADYWENPNLTFTPQDLPSWDDFYAAYPRKADGSGWLYGADNIYKLVGGDVLKVRQDDIEKKLTNNTCALKVSIALNGSGIIIPEVITRTVNGKINYGKIKGADGKNYFLNAKSLNKWMKLTFGTSPDNPNHYNYTAEQGGVGGKKFPSLIGNKKGIYSLNSSDATWASGHADIFFEDKCAAGCHYNARGLESIDIWVLD